MSKKGWTINILSSWFIWTQAQDDHFLDYEKLSRTCNVITYCQHNLTLEELRLKLDLLNNLSAPVKQVVRCKTSSRKVVRHETWSEWRSREEIPLRTHRKRKYEESALISRDIDFWSPSCAFIIHFAIICNIKLLLMGLIKHGAAASNCLSQHYFFFHKYNHNWYNLWRTQALNSHFIVSLTFSVIYMLMRLMNLKYNSDWCIYLEQSLISSPKTYWFLKRFSAGYRFINRTEINQNRTTRQNKTENRHFDRTQLWHWLKFTNWRWYRQFS